MIRSISNVAIPPNNDPVMYIDINGLFILCIIPIKAAPAVIGMPVNIVKNNASNLRN